MWLTVQLYRVEGVAFFLLTTQEQMTLVLVVFRPILRKLLKEGCLINNLAGIFTNVTVPSCKIRSTEHDFLKKKLLKNMFSRQNASIFADDRKNKTLH